MNKTNLNLSSQNKIVTDTKESNRIQLESDKKKDNVVSIHIKPATVCRSESNSTIDNKRETKEKEARSFLRDEFLGVLFTITNQPVKVKFEKTKEPLNTIFTGSDFTFSTISVKNLNTALGKEPQSLLRTSDITSISYETNLKE